MKNKKKKSHKLIWSLIILLLVIFVGITLVESKNISQAPTSTVEAPTYDFAKQQFVADGTPLEPQDITNYTTSPDGTRAASILVQNFGGSGTFYYLVGGMNNGSSTIYSEPESLGDRIVINSVDVTNPNSTDNGLITVEYLDRAPTDPMSTAPSVKTVVKYTWLEDGNLVEVKN